MQLSKKFRDTSNLDNLVGDIKIFKLLAQKTVNH